ncbi:MAG: hypothetical protein WA958_21185 [Tunicatimonas sp.]
MKAAFSSVLAIVVLINSTGVILASHFCGGQLAEVGVALGSASVGCGMEETAPPCDGVIVSPSSCCQDQYTVLTTYDGYPAYTAVPAVVLPLVTLLRWALLPRVASIHRSFPFPPTPPPLTVDRFVWHQSFLI